MTLGVGKLLYGAIFILKVDLDLHQGRWVWLKGTEEDFEIEENGGVELDEEVAVLFRDVGRGIEIVEPGCRFLAEKADGIGLALAVGVSKLIDLAYTWIEAEAAICFPVLETVDC